MYFLLSAIWLGVLGFLGFLSTQAGVDGVMAATIMGIILVPCLCLMTTEVFARRP